jgi:hypothetical protein
LLFGHIINNTNNATDTTTTQTTKSHLEDARVVTENRLRALLNNEELIISLDPLPMLDRVTQPNRLKLLRTLVTDYGRGYYMEAAAKRVDKFLETTAGRVVKILDRRSNVLARTGLPGPSVLHEKVAAEPRDSPAVLRPLVMAVKQCCAACPGMGPRIGAVISEVILPCFSPVPSLPLLSQHPAIVCTTLGGDQDGSVRQKAVAHLQRLAAPTLCLS